MTVCHTLVPNGAAGFLSGFSSPASSSVPSFDGAGFLSTFGGFFFPPPLSGSAALIVTDSACTIPGLPERPRTVMVSPFLAWLMSAMSTAICASSAKSALTIPLPILTTSLPALKVFTWPRTTTVAGNWIAAAALCFSAFLTPSPPPRPPQTEVVRPGGADGLHSPGEQSGEALGRQRDNGQRTNFLRDGVLLVDLGGKLDGEARLNEVGGGRAGKAYPGCRCHHDVDRLAVSGAHDETTRHNLLDGALPARGPRACHPWLPCPFCPPPNPWP